MLIEEERVKRLKIINLTFSVNFYLSIRTYRLNSLREIEIEQRTINRTMVLDLSLPIFPKRKHGIRHSLLDYIVTDIIFWIILF
jgi:hypothetical protein